MATALEEQIRVEFEKEQARSEPVRTLDELPRSYDDISDTWWTAAMCRDVPGAQVIAHRLDDADDGSNNRRRVFLEYNAPGEAARLPPSVFCKATHGLANRLMLGHTHGVVSEGTFYKLVRPQLTFETPACYFANFSEQTYNSIVVLEDIAPRGRFCRWDDYIDLDRVKAKIDILVDLHSRYYDAPVLSSTLTAFPTWHQRFNSFLKFHLEESCTTGFLASEDVVPTRLYARSAEVWPATVAAVEAHKDLPLALCHGDTHLKNWYFTDDGGSGLADWGSIVRGHWSRDLAYMMSTCLTVEDRRSWQDDLIRYYVDGMAARGIDLGTAEQVQAWFRQSLLASLAWWTLCVQPAGGDFPFLHEPNSVRCFVGRMATAIDDNDALDACLVVA